MTREALRALGDRIGDAVLDHVDGVAHVRAQSDRRGVRERTTHVGLHVRVGDWQTGGAATIEGHDRAAATAKALASMRARLAARAVWCEQMGRACRAALEVLP